MVEKAMARWRTPVLALMFQEWWGYMEQEKAAIHARAQHEAMTELKQNLEDELASSKTHAEKECERRMGMSKRVVARMLHIQLAQAFDSYSERVQECKERKATCKRLIHRMLHTQLAAAFDCFSEAIEQLAAHRTMVLKATSRWRTPALKEMFERWLDYVDRVKQEGMEEGNALAKREFADQLAKEKSVGEERVQQELLRHHDGLASQTRVICPTLARRQGREPLRGVPICPQPSGADCSRDPLPAGRARRRVQRSPASYCCRRPFSKLPLRSHSPAGDITPR
jgi:hypothetical protein